MNKQRAFGWLILACFFGTQFDFLAAVVLFRVLRDPGVQVTDWRAALIFGDFVRPKRK